MPHLRLDAASRGEEFHKDALLHYGNMPRCKHIRSERTGRGLFWKFITMRFSTTEICRVTKTSDLKGPEGDY
jgi:hypothetical protein